MKQYNVYAKEGNSYRFIGVENANSESSAIASYSGYSTSDLQARELFTWDCYCKEGSNRQFIETIYAETSDLAILIVRKLYRLVNQEIIVKKLT